MNQPFRMLACAALLLPALASAQDPQLKLPDFRSLAHSASDSVDISLGPWLLHMAGSLVDDKDPDAANTRKLLAGIESVQVRSYEFASDSAYSTADIDIVRQQLNGPGWTRLLQSRDHHSGENVDIYVMMDDGRAKGLALIASEPRQVTIINIAGSISLADLPKVARQLQLPAVKLPITQTTNASSATDETL